MIASEWSTQQPAGSTVYREPLALPTVARSQSSREVAPWQTAGTRRSSTAALPPRAAVRTRTYQGHSSVRTKCHNLRRTEALWRCRYHWNVSDDWDWFTIWSRKGELNTTNEFWEAAGRVVRDAHTLCSSSLTRPGAVHVQKSAQQVDVQHTVSCHWALCCTTLRTAPVRSRHGDHNACLPDSRTC